MLIKVIYPNSVGCSKRPKWYHKQSCPNNSYLTFQFDMAANWFSSDISRWLLSIVSNHTTHLTTFEIRHKKCDWHTVFETHRKMSHVNFLRHKITNQNIRFGSISVENETFCSFFQPLWLNILYLGNSTQLGVTLNTVATVATDATNFQKSYTHPFTKWVARWCLLLKSPSSC